MKRCIYCNEVKPAGQFDTEHILPRAIGGALQPVNPFTTNETCKTCNSIAGLYIDAPFTKNYFINNYRATSAGKFRKFGKGVIFPLTFMGTIKELTFGSKICENYLGPTGDLIYHFHDPYPQEPDMSFMVGVPPNLRKKKNEIDAGFVFIFIKSDNPQWHPTIIRSIICTFPDSQLYLANTPTPKIAKSNFADIPSHLNEIHECLWSLQEREHSMQFSGNVNSDHRFLAKFALGLGSVLLNENFKGSSDAALLRKFMREKDASMRNKIPLRGSGFLNNISGLKDANETMRWEGGHVLYLLPSGNDLLLYMNFYGLAGSLIQVTTNKDHWKGIADKGMLYVIMPEMQRCVGPIHVVEFIAHKSEHNYKHPKLEELENEILNLPPLPPFHLNQ